jgi:hypothetical protein
MDGDVLPIWRLLASVDTKPTNGEEVAEAIICTLHTDGGSWKPALLAALENIPPGTALLITAELGLSAAIVRRPRLPWRRDSRPSRRKLVRLVEESGVVVEALYDVWPSARSPRVVVGASGSPAFRWMQRSGILGGGRRLPVRALARSPLFTALGRIASPGIAIVARRKEAGDIK